MLAKRNNEKRYTLEELFQDFDWFLKSNKLKYEMTKPSFKAELKELVKDNIGICKVKNSVIKYYVNIEQFKQYCQKKKYDLFEDDENDEEEQHKLESVFEDDTGIVFEDLTKNKKYQQLLKLFKKN